MSQADDARLAGSLLGGDVSSAWAVWSSAALADAFCFAGGPVPNRGLVLGRGAAKFRVVRLGGPKVRSNAVDPADGGDVHLYRDSSLAPLLDLRRHLKVVYDVIGDMLRNGFILARSLELAAQWSCILSAGPLHPVTMDDLLRFQGVAWVGFMRLLVIFMLGFLSLFVGLLFIVEMRLLGVGGVGFVRTLWSGLIDGCVQIWFLLLPFLRCDPRLTLGGSGVLADPARIDEEFREAWLPCFCRSVRREASLEEFDEEVEYWLPLLPEVELPLTGDDLLQVVLCKTATAGSLDGWGWRELKSLPVPWFDGSARILAEVEELGVWPQGSLDAFFALIPKVGGDSPLLVSVLCVFFLWLTGSGLLPV